MADVKRIALTLLLAVSSAASAEQVPTDETADVQGRTMQVTIREATLGEQDEKVMGTVRVTEVSDGLLFEPSLKGLEPGLHGFHVHENPSCDEERSVDDYDAHPEPVAAGAAGDHLDPGFKGNHGGPFDEGHLGDLPNLYVNQDGLAEHPIFAPRLRLRDLESRALVVHADPDNYSDEPEPNGGSGSRVACGVIRSAVAE
ncbi:superoxide dismutase family protein [Marinobacter fonticola]|uniref:superoxide dismutase family protein n=1 Tax=Marinobacter fonticola TaxID=2603215 RepID=UPI0011E6A312|nr:superoxide dismutase family protein [Marinobacter fonticola]